MDFNTYLLVRMSIKVNCCTTYPNRVEFIQNYSSDMELHLQTFPFSFIESEHIKWFNKLKCFKISKDFHRRMQNVSKFLSIHIINCLSSFVDSLQTFVTL